LSECFKIMSLQFVFFNRNPGPSNNNATGKYTPLEKQVLELKKQHSGMILMVQTAYKYTFFGDDAEVCFEYQFFFFNL
jgi:Mismatch repair ATPase (MutS family)